MHEVKPYTKDGYNIKVYEVDNGWFEAWLSGCMLSKPTYDELAKEIDRLLGCNGTEVDIFTCDSDKMKFLRAKILRKADGRTMWVKVEGQENPIRVYEFEVWKVLAPEEKAAIIESYEELERRRQFVKEASDIFGDYWERFRYKMGE